jgi:hypothetical protein
VVYVCKNKEYVCVCVSFGCYACNIRKCESRKIKSIPPPYGNPREETMVI